MRAADHRAIRDRVYPPERGWRDLTTQGGAQCCREAVALVTGDRYHEPCVCFFLEYCPTHHRVTHVGTHD